MRQKGLILLTSLLMLIVLSLLVLSQMHLLWLQQKAMNQLLDKHRLLQNLERQASRLLSGTPGCVIKAGSPNAALRSEQACTVVFDKQTYRYVIEDLGIFPCLSIQGNSSQHWRISLASDVDHSRYLQLRVARMAGKMACENQALRVINAGIQSWRYIG